MTALSYTAGAGPAHQPFIAYIKHWLPKALKRVAKPPAEVSIALVGNATMAGLHKQFMNIDGPTDVLTFEIDHDVRGKVTSGEVVVCVPYARREAKRRRVDVRHELLLYSLHGVLHLSGYDDLTAKEHARMHREEDRILEKIGIGTVFNRPLQVR